MKAIILASSSKQRSDIFKRAHIPFTVEESGYEEDMTLTLAPHELVQHLAEGKARAVAVRHPDALIIGADTVVACDGKVFGKPSTPQEGREMLKILSGKTHTVLTGFVVIDSETGKKISRTVATDVRFKALSDEDIDSYIADGEFSGKAGGYAIQGSGSRFVERIQGDMDNVIGLPLQALLEELAKFGIAV